MTVSVPKIWLCQITSMPAHVLATNNLGINFEFLLGLLSPFCLHENINNGKMETVA